MSSYLFGTGNVLPKVRHPFFIVTPPYTRVSAGVTVLHLLCHHLNLLGENAFIVHYPPEQGPLRSLPYYVTLQMQREFPGGMQVPLITQDVIDFYDEQRLTPIVIYPEVFDNPFKAHFFGRYILNYPGKLNTKYQEHENFGFAYTKILADHCNHEYSDHPSITDTLFVPTPDLEFWSAQGAEKDRKGSCFYMGKTAEILGSTPDNLPDDAIEILRSTHMSRENIRALFWKSEVFYCYEDSALAIEAQLCGCPTIFVPTEHFSGMPLAFNELGTDGSCMSSELSELARAQATVHKFEHVIRSHMELVPARIAELAIKWKAMVAEQDYRGSISYPYEPRLVFFERCVPGQFGFAERNDLDAVSVNSVSRARLSVFVGMLREEGIRAGIKRALRGLRRHGLFDFVRLLFGVMPGKKL